LNTDIYRTGAIELRWVTNIDKNDYISVRNNWIEKILFMKIDHWSQSTDTNNKDSYSTLFTCFTYLWQKPMNGFIEGNWESNV